MSRVLVARLDSMGDVLLAGPAIRAVACRHEVVMLCSRKGADAARLLPGVRDVIVWDSPWTLIPAPQLEWGRVGELVELLRTRQFDEALILTSFHQSPLPLALVLRLAGVPKIAGASVDHAGSLLDVRLIPGEDFEEDQHEVSRALVIAAAAGYTLPAHDPGRLAVRHPANVSKWVGHGEYVVVHPGSEAPARTWPEGHHAALVGLLATAGHRVVVTGGPAERSLTAHVAGLRGLNLGGRLTLPELAGVLAQAKVVVAGNTGPAHLAAAVGTPVVSLFSPVVPAVRWAPYGVPFELLGNQLAPCRGSRARECPLAGHPCLAGVAPQEALAAVERLLGRDASPERDLVAPRGA